MDTGTALFFCNPLNKKEDVHILKHKYQTYHVNIQPSWVTKIKQKLNKVDMVKCIL